MVIYVTLYHRIDFHVFKPGLLGRLDTIHHLADGAAPAGHLAEYGFVQTIQADCDSTQTRFFKCRRIARQ